MEELRKKIEELEPDFVNRVGTAYLDRSKVLALFEKEIFGLSGKEEAEALQGLKK